MDSPRASPITAPESTRPQRAEQRDLSLANLNAGLWAIGNGLVSTTLVWYLASEFGAKGLAISLILAAPRFAGVLRLLTPVLLSWLRMRKAICLAAFAASAATLLGMLVAALPGRLPTASASINVLVAGWCLYHLLEYVGTVLLWSWLSDLMPRATRGLLIGHRERWLVGGRVVGMAVSFGFAVCWEWLDPGQSRWVPLMYSAAFGALFLMLAVAPLMRMRRADGTPSAVPRSVWKSLFRCLGDPAYRRLLGFSCGLAVANGVTLTAQSLYPARVLGFRYEHTLAMRAAMRAGQGAIAPWLGSLIDRRGTRQVMFVSQLIVATGPLFFWLANAAVPWWIFGAYLAWIAYAGVNVGLDHQKLAVAPDDNNTPAIAAYYVISDLAAAGMIILGGLVFDRLSVGGDAALTLYAALFLIGWLARTLVAGLALRLVDPLASGAAPESP